MQRALCAHVRVLSHGDASTRADTAPSFAIAGVESLSLVSPVDFDATEVESVIIPLG